ncbi:MAG: transglutaminase domain-containing protein [Anaerolineales bacterium]
MVSVNQPFEATWRVQPPTKNAILDMDMLGAITNSQSYSADSILPLLNETELRAAPQTYPKEIRDKYIKLPASISPRVLDLAQQLTANSENAYDKAKAIETYLRTTYPYTLDVPPLPPNKEIADYFLFELKKGYCDYYATSMIVLARAAGLPARLVIGYASGDYDRAKAEYVVRELHAHSWVEIYFPQVGWVEFEPTASQPIIERPLNASDSQVSFEASAFRRDRDGRDYLKFGHFGKENDRSAYIPFLGMFIVIAGIVVYYLYTQGLRLSYPTIGSVYQYIYLHGQLLYQNSPVYETPSLFAEKLKKRITLNRRMLHPAAGELDTLTRLYLQETYSAHPITQDERVEAIRIWRKLFWRLLYVRVLINRSLGD